LAIQLTSSRSVELVGLGGGFVGEQTGCERGVARRARTAAIARARDQQSIVMLQRAAVGEVIRVAGVDEEDSHFLTVLTGHEGHQSTEEDAYDKTHGGFSFSLSFFREAANGEEAWPIT
jgi:hypothetical protein